MKAMRKGTRACAQCRRRKLKCNYPEGQYHCEECATHHRECVSQGMVTSNNGSMKQKQRLRVRVSKLESIIEKLNQGGGLLENFDPNSPRHLSIAGGHQSKSTMVGSELADQTESPLFALFDNDVLVRRNKQPPIPSTSTSISFGDPATSDRDKLLSTISNEPNTLGVLGVAGSWWLAWQDQYPGLKELQIAQSLHDYVTYHLQQERPIMVTVGLLCLAMSLQHLRPGIDDADLHFAVSSRELMERILAAVDQVVLSNENHFLCGEGIMAFMFRAKIHAESNQLRKCWLRLHGAILAAQKIGLATPQSEVTQLDLVQRQRFVGSLFEQDRFLSLVLGMPYVADERFTDVLASQVLSQPAETDIKMRALRRVTAIAAGKINDRNGTGATLDLEITSSIERTLGGAAASMPPSWWNIEHILDQFHDPQIAHEHLMAQLWFHHVQMLLHLPLMLAASSESAFEPNRAVCLSAARGLVQVYHSFDHDPSLKVYTCKCESFQGLLAGIVIVIGLLQHAMQGTDPEGSTFDHDLDLLEITKETFRWESQQQGGSIAKQGLQVLESLTTFLEDPFQTSRETNLFIPYFGTITVQANSAPVGRAKSGSPAQADQLPTPTSLDSETRGDFGFPQGNMMSTSDMDPNFLNFTEQDLEGFDFSQPMQPIDLAFNFMLGQELDLNWNDFALPMDTSSTVDPVDVMARG